MKRYFNFLRSSATVSLVVLYSFVTFFVPFSAAAEEATRSEIITDPVAINKSAVKSVEKLPEIPAQESQTNEEFAVDESEKEEEAATENEEGKEGVVEVISDEVAVEEILVTETDGSSNPSREVTVVDSTESLVESTDCSTGTAPVITFENDYVDARPGGILSLMNLLPQIGAFATDAEDGDIEKTNNINELPFPLESGWYEIDFTATDSDGCSTTETVDLFVIGDSYEPVCESGEVYVRFNVPDTLIARLGTGTQVFSGEWFPVMYDGGETFSESDLDISSSYDISIVRTGNTLLVNVDSTISGAFDIAGNLAESIEIVGGGVTSALVFSGDVAVIDFEGVECPEDPVVDCDRDFNGDGTIDGEDVDVLTSKFGSVESEDLAIYDLDNNGAIQINDLTILLTLVGTICSSDVCDVTNGPEISVTNTTVSIDEGQEITIEEVIALFGITATDLDGEGDVAISHNLTQDQINNGGTYTITITAIDDEGCESILTATLDVDGGGSTGSGCANPNGCGGGNNGSDPEEEPEGEVLGVATCEVYITTFIKMGEVNHTEDVRKLQIFLNDYMGEELIVDGIYGQNTFEAVKRFQLAEADEILEPWGITEATGIVRETTSRRINNIMCPDLNIQIPTLYCVTIDTFIYPDGTVVEPEVYYESIGITYPINQQSGSVLGDYSQNSPLLDGYNK